MTERSRGTVVVISKLLIVLLMVAALLLLGVCWWIPLNVSVAALVVFMTIGNILLSLLYLCGVALVWATWADIFG
jgi:hypothetical protein